MGTLYIVATPIGNLSDISERALDVLRNVRYILAEDTRHTSQLLRHYGIAVPMISLHKFNEFSKSSAILDRILSEGCDAALVSDAGTPCISDPGSLLTGLAHEKNMTIIGIPGACAMAAAVSVCGFDASAFSFIGFFPRTKQKKEATLDLIRNSAIEIFVIYESPLRLPETLAFLLTNFPDAECAVCNDLTKLHEKTVKGPLAEVYALLASSANVHKGEYVVVFKRNSAVPQKVQDDISLEAKILDHMVKNRVSVKTAVKQLAENKVSPKSALYQASLCMKNIIKIVPEAP
jgi:16S rRNA (cytidine1402-2'-O)-methyltransferase